MRVSKCILSRVSNVRVRVHVCVLVLVCVWVLVLVCLCACAVDLDHERQVSSSSAMELTKGSMWPFVEVSNKTGEHTEAAWKKLLKDLCGPKRAFSTRV